MKYLKIIFTIAAILASTLTNSVFAKENKKEQKVTYKVNMDCENCVKKIESNISYEKGVKDLKVSLEDKECVVTFRSDKTSKAEIVKAFNKLGYIASEKVVTPIKNKTLKEEGQKQNN